MRISGDNTFLVGDPLEVLALRAGRHRGLGEVTLDALGATVETAVHELEDPYLGQDPANIELIIQRMGAGTVDADGSNAFESDVYAIVPGGTLPLTGSYARSAPESTNGEGSSTAPYGAALSCDTYGLSGCGVTTIIQ